VKFRIDFEENVEKMAIYSQGGILLGEGREVDIQNNNYFKEGVCTK
jgi:hypothetical protein